MQNHTVVLQSVFDLDGLTSLCSIVSYLVLKISLHKHINGQTFSSDNPMFIILTCGLVFFIWGWRGYTKVLGTVKPYISCDFMKKTASMLSIFNFASLHRPSVIKFFPSLSSNAIGRGLTASSARAGKTFFSEVL